MNLKFKISILHIAVSFITIFFIYMVYDTYVLSQKDEIKKQLTRILNLNQAHMQKSLVRINQLLENKKELTQEIHLSLHNHLKENPKANLQELRNNIKKEFQLENKKVDIEVFLVDKYYYRVIDSTEAKNLNRNLSFNKKSKESLDSLSYIDQYNRSNDVSVDFLDYELKNYSYSKLEEELYLGLGVIYKEALDHRKDFDEMRKVANTHIDLFCVMKDSNNNLFYESLVAHKKPYETTADYNSNIKRYAKDEITNNPIIKTSKNWEEMSVKKDNTLKFYIPLLKEDNPIMGIPGDIILQVDLDISQEKEFFQTIIFKLILFIVIHFILLFIIFYFTKKYQSIQEKLEKENNKHKDLVNYNKNFISNMVHQIRTPLSIILTNISFMETLLKTNVSKYSSQVNAAINSLSNSYENLSYYISYKNLKYTKRKIDISNFIKERVIFFDEIAQANKKSILLNIKEKYEIDFNDIELERLIDNNISNALKNGDIETNIIIRFYKKDDIYNLEFKAYSKNLVLNNLFKKSEETLLKDTSNTSLGVYVIKKICEKNKIIYKCEKKDDSFTFKYSWK
ncbi:sensor histidine kinase [Malaciobacter pacificus]|uniref:histidine kinase n=1 Tax=Malaciobacter pacificus TaxID=1080223 RepID=A0A5C2HE13_9BACT|nr:histidine kinase dimerization/phospho-acceptor domain-containing protein [Malaciobacter pacificus]QEP35406.1 two-component system sensor histidine kinase [Malaciobacter pacificus]